MFPARTMLLKSFTNTMFGHFHKTSDYTKQTGNGELLGCWSVGYLGSKYQEYAPFPFNDWNHGASHVKVDKDGMFHVNNFRILDGKIL